MAKPVDSRDDQQVRALASEIDQRGKAAASELGPGADAMRASEADLARWWAHQLPLEQATTMMQWAQAVVEGGQQVPPPTDQDGKPIHPHPEKVLEWYGMAQEADAAGKASLAKSAAEALAAEIAWPLRRDLYERGRPNIKDQATEARRLRKLAERHAGQEQEAATAAPVGGQGGGY